MNEADRQMYDRIIGLYKTGQYDFIEKNWIVFPDELKDDLILRSFEDGNNYFSSKSFLMQYGYKDLARIKNEKARLSILFDLNEEKNRELYFGLKGRKYNSKDKDEEYISRTLGVYSMLKNYELLTKKYSFFTPTSFDKINWLRSAFEKIFNINGYAVTAYITGLICGFPLGVKVGVDLYKGGFISKGECERLIGFSNNTGPAFVMGGVGFGLRGSIKDGIILYFSMLASSIIAGFIIGIGKHCTKKDAKCNYGAAYEFTASVKNAASNTLNICAFVVFFSVVSGILNLIVQNEAVYSVIVSLAEVSNAAKALAKGSFPRIISLILTSFAISFSGISVHMQARCFISDTDISMKCYYGTKILQGTRAAAITALLSVF